MICPIVLALCHANPPSSLSMLSKHLSGTVCHWTSQSVFPYVEFDKRVFLWAIPSRETYCFVQRESAEAGHFLRLPTING